jgi:hypothetical protein
MPLSPLYCPLALVGLLQGELFAVLDNDDLALPLEKEASHFPPRRTIARHSAETAWGTGGPRFKSGRPD